MKVVLCYSGGLDSTVLLYHLIVDRHEVFALGFDYGQRHKRELNAALEITIKTKTPFTVVPLDLSFGGAIVSRRRRGGFRAPPSEIELVGAPTIVPGRNLLFLSAAMAHALAIGAEAVAIAAHAGDAAVYPDCREPFLQQFETLTQTYYARDFQVLRPYVGITKHQVMRIGRELHVPFDKTWSCYAGETLPCGKCGACIERASVLGTHENQGMTFARSRLDTAQNGHAGGHTGEEGSKKNA